MKKVIWIDDDENAMKNTIRSVFLPLWEKNIRSDVYILGDDIEERSFPRKEYIKDLNNVIYDEFISFLVEEDYINDNDKISSCLGLISSQKKESNLEEINVAIDKNDEVIKYIGKDIKKWKEMSTKIPEEEMNSLLENIRMLFKNILNYNEKKVVLVDLCLLKNDYKKLCGPIKELPPIFSMGLYKVLSEKEDCKAFLYTTYASPDDVVKKWCNKYAQTYSEEDVITIYRRNGEPVNKKEHDENKKLYEKIIDFFEEEK